MLTEIELFENSLEYIFNKYFNKNKKFKENSLKKIKISTPVRKIPELNAEYTYGYSEIYGMWSILIDNDNEGFMFFIGSYKSDNKSYQSFTNIYTTKKFNFMKKRFKTYLNIGKLREIQKKYYYNHNLAYEDFLFDLMRKYLFSVKDYNYGSLTRARKSEIILLSLVIDNGYNITWTELEKLNYPHNIKVCIERYVDSNVGHEIEFISNLVKRIIEKNATFFRKNYISVESLFDLLYGYAITHMNKE